MWYGKYEEQETEDERIARKVREELARRTGGNDSMIGRKGDKWNREAEESES